LSQGHPDTLFADFEKISNFEKIPKRSFFKKEQIYLFLKIIIFIIGANLNLCHNHKNIQSAILRKSLFRHFYNFGGFQKRHHFD